MQINFFAGLDSREAPTSGATFHSEHRTERRLARSDDHFFADQRQTLGQADGGDRLAFAGSGRGVGRDQNQFSAALKSGIGQKFQPQLGSERSQLFEILG